MKVLHLISAGILFFGMGCRSPKQKAIYHPKITIDFSKAVADTSVDVIENIKAVVLKNNQDSNLISEASKVITDSGKIYLLDRKLSQLSVFDTTGHYLYNIGQVGMDPGEFLNIKDFQIGSERIIVFSDLGRKLIFFDKNSHKFINQIMLPFFASSFFQGHGGDFVFYTGNNPASPDHIAYNNIIWTDQNINIKQRQFPYRPSKKISGTTGAADQTETGEFLYNPAFSDSVYAFSSGETRLKYLLKFEHPVPPEFQVIDRFYTMPFAKGLSYNFLTSIFHENNDQLFISYQGNKRLDNPGIFDKRTGHFIAGAALRSFRNYPLRFVSQITGQDGRSFIFNLDPGHVDFLRDHDRRLFEEVKKNRFPGVDKIILGLKPESSPVILFIKFKKV